MIATIEVAASAVYVPRMLRSLMIRLLTMAAVLMLPFAMAAAPAAPATAHHSSAAVPADHCSDNPAENATGTVGHNCMMPCSAALPAPEPAPDQDSPVSRGHAPASPEPKLAGILLEIATPPPKLS